jgi:hydroxymethylglutaryl-CoA lyase
MTGNISIIECPRDAMQGWKQMIPTEKKLEYINALLQVGFDTIDFGSFVSPKAIPQMADTHAVLKELKRGNSKTKLLAIVANRRGAEEAVVYDAIHYLGFPFSVSPTFQLRNTNSSIENSLEMVESIQELCLKNKKELVVYLSMAFGNPYNDLYNEEILLSFARKIASLEIRIISLADTVGVASPFQIQTALKALVPSYPAVAFGVHLHSSALNWKEKLNAALEAGCKRIDGAILGIGGCPMANDDLVGNLNTLNILSLLKEKNIPVSLNETALEKCVQLAGRIFNKII